MLMGSVGKRRRLAALSQKLDRAHAQELCDQLDSFGIGHELAGEAGLFVVRVGSADLALARALTGQAGIEPAARPPAGARLLRRAAILPLVGAAVAVGAWVGGGASPAVAATAAVDGYHGSVYQSDDDGDGYVDRKVVFDAHGIPASVIQDIDHDGVMDRFLDIGVDEVVVHHDDDRDGIPD